VTDEKSAPAHSWRSVILTVLSALIVANIAIFAIEHFLLTPVRVPTNSMVPTLYSGDRALVTRQTDLDDLERGDLVVFAVDPDESKPVDAKGENERILLVKRVIGMPGEDIEAHNGVVAVGIDKRVKEPYLMGRRGSTEIKSTPIPKDHVWVLGDNRDHSIDSRKFGPVPADSIVGRVALRFWPWNRLEVW
jgi:signal peptidase I